MAESLKRVPKNSSISSPKMTWHPGTLTHSLLHSSRRRSVQRRPSAQSVPSLSLPLLHAPSLPLHLAFYPLCQGRSQVSRARYAMPKVRHATDRKSVV